jgi:hypothetical protein
MNWLFRVAAHVRVVQQLVLRYGQLELGTVARRSLDTVALPWQALA